MRLITSRGRKKEPKRNRCARQQKILQLLADADADVHVAVAYYVFSFSRSFLSLNDAKHAIAIKSVDITLTHSHLLTHTLRSQCVCYGFSVPFERFHSIQTHSACYHRVINYSSESRHFFCLFFTPSVCASFLFQLIHAILSFAPQFPQRKESP